VDFRSKRTFGLCLWQLERLKPHTKKSKIDWLELDEEDPEFQLLTQDKIAAILYLYLFTSALSILLNFLLICCPSYCFRAIFCFINPDDIPPVNPN
jgi:hypothetical protein